MKYSMKYCSRLSNPESFGTASFGTFFRRVFYPYSMMLLCYYTNTCSAVHKEHYVKFNASMFCHVKFNCSLKTRRHCHVSLRVVSM